MKSLKEYLKLRVNSSNDVAGFSVSWVVDVFNHGEDVHTPPFKCSTCSKGKELNGGEVWQSRSIFTGHLLHLS